MAPIDIRQDKTYRRGLLLGLTMAEIMVLLIFLLLMALGEALGSREERLRDLEATSGRRLVEVIRRAYPEAKSEDEYYKELVRALDARRVVEGLREVSGRQLIEDTKLGRNVREAAIKVGMSSPERFIDAMVDDRINKKSSAGWPPFFSLSEAGGYYFDSGKATLRPEFRQKLTSLIVPLLHDNIEKYGVDVVEVIGHTDEVPMSGVSNLDGSLISAYLRNFEIGDLVPADNSGLAISRAVAVVSVLRADPRLQNIAILPLSGAQMIVPVDRVADGKANGADQLRRRVEIRLRRSSGQVAEASGM